MQVIRVIIVDNCYSQFYHRSYRQIHNTWFVLLFWQFSLIPNRTKVFGPQDVICYHCSEKFCRNLTRDWRFISSHISNSNLNPCQARLRYRLSSCMHFSQPNIIKHMWFSQLTQYFLHLFKMLQESGSGSSVSFFSEFLFVTLLRFEESVLRIVAPFRLVRVYQRFRSPHCRHHQGDK
jgi:hypothetical protein